MGYFVDLHCAGSFFFVTLFNLLVNYHLTEGKAFCQWDNLLPILEWPSDAWPGPGTLSYSKYRLVLWPVRSQVAWTWV